MKFAIGYYDHDELLRPFDYALNEFGNHIQEVYFPWPSMATCRTTAWEGFAFEKLIYALTIAANSGIKLDMLFNANCYGGRAISKELESKVCASVEDELARVGKLHSVTTTSFAVAHIVKKYFPGLKVRASINMQLRDEKCVPPLLELFDEFYLPRELNYDFEAIKRWKEILGNKSLYFLANSGCMAWCAGQIFHDNLVAHEADVSQTRNIDGFMPYICWSWYKNNPSTILQNSTWIRPEDIGAYEPYFDMAKLATRINSRPYRVIKAYINGSFCGNTLNLMEPDHSAILGAGMIDNTAFPDDWLKQKSTGALNCTKIFSNVYLNMDKDYQSNQMKDSEHEH